jgi:hypothetical protein
MLIKMQCNVFYSWSLRNVNILWLSCKATHWRFQVPGRLVVFRNPESRILPSLDGILLASMEFLFTAFRKAEDMFACVFYGSVLRWFLSCRV